VPAELHHASPTAAASNQQQQQIAGYAPPAGPRFSLLDGKWQITNSRCQLPITNRNTGPLGNNSLPPVSALMLLAAPFGFDI
jgi:hypothetical protein